MQSNTIMRKKNEETTFQHEKHAAWFRRSLPIAVHLI